MPNQLCKTVRGVAAESIKFRDRTWNDACTCRGDSVPALVLVELSLLIAA
jgi:hypothetical protein